MEGRYDGCCLCVAKEGCYPASRAPLCKTIGERKEGVVAAMALIGSLTLPSALLPSLLDDISGYSAKKWILQ